MKLTRPKRVSPAKRNCGVLCLGCLLFGVLVHSPDHRPDFAPMSSTPVTVVSSGGTDRRLHESVREELVRLQKQTGLTLATDDGRMGVVSFDKRTLIYGKNLYRAEQPQVARSMGVGVVSRDGTEAAGTLFYLGRGSLALVQSDGSNLREYSNIRPQDICWSNDNSKLAITVQKSSEDSGFVVLDLASNVTRTIDSRVTLTTQCWSPDDGRVVYETGGTIKVDDVRQDRSSLHILGDGHDPTWSPDGKWIAYFDHNTYYIIHPDGQGRKKLFHCGDPFSPLYWSPDSRIVAYIVVLGFLQGGAPDAELYRLRVRRIQDSSQDWVAEGQIAAGNFQWVKNPELLRQVESESEQK